MKFHVNADAHGELVAWIAATPATDSGPRLVMRSTDPTHVLHENIEIDARPSDREGLAVALKKALADRVGRRR